MINFIHSKEIGSDHHTLFEIIQSNYEDKMTRTNRINE